MQIKQKRITRTNAVVSFYLFVGAMLLLCVHKYIKNNKYIILGITLLLVNIITNLCFFLKWRKHHKLKNGIKYAKLHIKMENSLIQALYDDGYYVERNVLFKKCAVIPRLDITISSKFDNGVIKIENCIKLDKRLEELPISSALPDEYILSSSYISDDCNYYIYEFELYHVEQMSFHSSKDFFEYSRKNTGDYELFLDSRYKVSIFHALIVGQTGSGKSYCLYNFVLQLLSKKCDVDLYIADPKFSGLYVLGRAINPEKVASSVEEIIALLRQFEKKMLERKKAFADCLVKKLDSDYRAFGFSPICLIIDEYSSFKASLARYDKKTRDGVDEIIGNTIREGRQLGCFCFIAQQQTNANNLSTELKENLPFKLILGMAERQTYITALGVYPDVAKRKIECGQGLLVYPQISTPEMPAVTSIARLDFDILKSVEYLEEYKNDGKEGQAGVM